MELGATADWLVLAGRVMFAYLFLMSGIGHLAAREQMAGYAASKGLPAASFLVPVTGLMIIAGAVGIALGVWMDLAFALILAFLVPTAFAMHAWWRESDDGARMNEQVQFNKDISLAGAALMLLVLTAAMGDGIGLTLTGPLFEF